MDTIIFDNKSYTRQNNKWFDDNYSIVNREMQFKLDNIFADKIDFENKHPFVIMEEADKYKTPAILHLRLNSIIMFYL